MTIFTVLSAITLAGIAVCITHFCLSLKTKNQYSPYSEILNIALIPIDEKDINDIAAISKDLNKPQSLYSLHDVNEKAGANGSLPHCTLMHFRVPISQEERMLLLKRLKPLMGQKILLTINEPEMLETNAFIRDEFLKDRPINSTMIIKWLPVTKTPELLALQENIVATIADNKAYITQRGSTYRPHFTLWCQDKDKYLSLSSTHPDIGNHIPSLKKHTILCKTAIGICGKNGQFEKIDFLKKEI